MTPIVAYLKEGRLPEEKDEARKLRIRSARYILMDEVLYKRGFSQPYLRCLALDEANYVLREVYEGACETHLEARVLVHKVIITGLLFKQTQRLMSRCVTNVNALAISPSSHQSISPR